MRKKMPRRWGLAATVLLHLAVALVWLSPAARTTGSIARPTPVRVTLLPPLAAAPQQLPMPTRQARPTHAMPTVQLASFTPEPPVAMPVAVMTAMAAAPAPQAQPVALPPPPTQAQAADTYRPATPPDRACADAQIARHYPPLLRERGIEGRVVLRVQVDAQGRAADVQVSQGSGWRLLDQAALLLTQDCRFSPARRGEQTLASWVEYPVRFALDPTH